MKVGGRMHYFGSCVSCAQDTGSLSDELIACNERLIKPCR
jgi:hypothetical protein